MKFQKLLNAVLLKRELFVVCSLFFVLAFVGPVNADTPQLISYQAYLTDSAGSPVTQTTNVTFNIWDDPIAGSSVWSETHVSVNIIGGNLTVLLGSVTPLDNSLFSDTGLYLGVQIGADPELSPRSRLTSVPYAYRTGTISGASGGSVSGAITISPDPAKATGDAVIILDGNNDTVMTTTTSVASAVEVSFYDPVDSKDGFAAPSILRIIISPAGIVMLDSTGADTTVIIDSDGQILVGPNSSGAVATTVFGPNNIGSGDTSSIGGGALNIANGDLSTVGGGKADSAIGYASTIGGGESNVALAEYSFIGGGQNNFASDSFSTVSGGQDNEATSGYTTIGGGGSNQASNVFSTVGGGESNRALVGWSTIGGGRSNLASQGGATVAGGWFNGATGSLATVGGGRNDTALGTYSGVASGYLNTAGDAFTDTAAFVGGGYENEATRKYATISGGRSNIAGGDYAAIGGGSSDTATGGFSTIPGGYGNLASGDFSFAAGFRAKAVHAGSFVWSSTSLAGGFSSSALDQFNVRAIGGVRMFTNDTLTSGVTMGAGASSWTSVSDKNVKKDFREVDSRELLEKLSEIPISRWKYMAEKSQADHIGPMAQDFYSAFGLGDDDKHISTIDADGVALAAIQALYSQNQELKRELEKIKKVLSKISNK